MIGGFGFWFSGIFGIWRQTSIADPGLYQVSSAIFSASAPSTHAADLLVAFSSRSPQKWGTAFSTFWGSWAFLIGS